MGDYMNMTGIIFSNIYDAYMGDLTKHRTLASLPFGGRYRLIDFVLSNMSNSGINNVGIITKYNYQSLIDHLGSCEEWDMSRKNSKVFILPPFGTGQTSVYQGKLEALYGALQFLRRTKEDYIMMSDCNVICNIDYELVMKEHIKSGAQLTVVANREDPQFEGELRDFVITADDYGIVTDLAIRHTFTRENLCGMGMFIIEKSLLLHAVEEAVSHGLYHFERDFVQKEFLTGHLSVNVYEFKRSVLRNRDIPSYFRNNCLILQEEVRKDIFDPQNPIYTKVRDEVPAFYDRDAEVDDCVIADGCRIEGKVSDSVIFRNVTIEKGATVDHCVVMQGTVIRAGANIRYTILDKDVEITEGRTLVGSDLAPVIIQKGNKI